jgi:uncharacterized Zn finger protein
MSYYFAWQPYVSVAEKRHRSELKLKKLKKKGQSIAPVRIEGRTIATSFWGQSWCANLERYSDYENRLPRGRSYVRNGSVLDLQIAEGEVVAMVSGSDLYKVKASIAPRPARRWKAICRDCAGSIDSLIELLQGRLAKGVMDRVCREGDGLFPSPDEIKLSCTCPDWADMCKHVAAVLYGVGARLDQKPELLFVLRGVDENELLASAGQGLLPTNAPASAQMLAESDVVALFGIEMAEPDKPETSLAPRRSKSKERLKKTKMPAPTATTAAAAKKSNSPRASRAGASRAGSGTKPHAVAGASNRDVPRRVQRPIS